jgi:hypothetical protein
MNPEQSREAQEPWWSESQVTPEERRQIDDQPPEKPPSFWESRRQRKTSQELSALGETRDPALRQRLEDLLDAIPKGSHRAVEGYGAVRQRVLTLFAEDFAPGAVREPQNERRAAWGYTISRLETLVEERARLRGSETHGLAK